MLYFVYRELALGYLWFAFLCALAALQVVAVRYKLNGLALLDYKERHWLGYVLGGALVMLGAASYFVSQWERIFTPGPAGSELALLFAAGALLALLLSLLVSTLRLGLGRRRHRIDPGSSQAQHVALGRATGELYVPPEPTDPMPAVCLIPGLGLANGDAMHSLARHLVTQRIVALVINPGAELYSYPETLATLPAATAYLTKRPEVDPNRLGAAGYDMGGDLVVRAAGAHEQLRAVAALAPVLREVAPGLGLLREMSYLEAWRWIRDERRTRLVTQLSALDHGSKIAPRPLLLLYGTDDQLAARTSPRDWDERDNAWITHQIVRSAAHLDLLNHPSTLNTVARWFRERL
jgi:hypothetical protein